eukprot:TRINITY_DN634_c0_g2_i10.p1 TRINITY_DN634_c0_g2~~TRINITY_DN634_c0_g2_i10.p1  ORF type:complete len:106 (-),score=3.82 TRINITY_DN634_c0_g2_i10:527-844(-)
MNLISCNDKIMYMEIYPRPSVVLSCCQFVLQCMILFKADFRCSNFSPKAHSKFNLNMHKTPGKYKNIEHSLLCEIENTSFNYYCLFVLLTSVIFTISFPRWCISM